MLKSAKCALLRQVVLEVLCFAVIVDDAVLEPAVNRGDDDVHDGMGTQGKVADLANLDGLPRLDTVSYTHLDVYKRQDKRRASARRAMLV